MRRFGRLSPTPFRATAAATTAVSSSAATYSTFSGGGGGRGRGRGTSPPPQPAGRTEPNPDRDDPFSGFGHGKPHPVLPSSPVLPSFSSFLSSPSVGRGRGRGGPPSQSPETLDPSAPKKPIFFRREEPQPDPDSKNPQFADPDNESTSPRHQPLPLPSLSGAGRGKPPLPPPDYGTKPPDSVSRQPEVNRHIRPRAAINRTPSETPVGPKLGREEAIKKAMEVLSRGGSNAGRGRTTGGRGRGRGGRGRGRDVSDDLNLYLGDNADGEKFEKRLGEENMKKVMEGFEEMSSSVLPSPLDDAYLDAMDTNNLIEYEPEYLVEFDRNPDIDEKPPMTLEEALEKAKPFLMAYEGIQSQEEWEEIIKQTMEKVPYMKELMDSYCGPDRVTAKQQQQELERVAKTLPENVPSSVKRFTDRAVLSLQSNPGWGWDKKCQFMDKVVWEVSQQYK